MGEKIKTLSTSVILNDRFEIELNHPPITGKDKQVHIQSSKFRLEMNESDFIKYAISILLAEKNLKNLKNID
jgi:hypothetical protein